jgi:hypothetical protein
VQSRNIEMAWSAAAETDAGQASNYGLDRFITA